MATISGLRIASLVLRILTFILLLVSIIILTTNTKTIGQAKIGFSNVNSYRYALATIVIGGAFNLLQIAFSIYHMVMKGAEGNLLFEFYGDKMLSYNLLGGAAAALGVGIDLKNNLSECVGDGRFDSFFDGANAAAAFLLLAFFTTFVVSILSSLALTKKS